ncbi:da188c2d-96a6-4f55-a7d8-52115f52d460 [Sclerotinia trifoliorum]|uniref:Da188c2d-96a6-4f55-a7d8-52115f52d460 n=1 Tax=Sclerotinia trifoliorum TaxID=28548 RepID=A0A8H2VP38_9HELO|nr:da188c2d-96a6-4f55-a7d8-52115f52d460 [Sclerotinia trifoliorum]
MDIYRLADFYCALPAFSHSLDSALHRSPIFTESIRRNSKSLLRIAKKLHHPVLFRECLIYQVAEIECFHKRESWISKFDDDKELKLSFMMALTRVRSLQDYIDQSIISSAEEVPSFRNFLTERGEVMWREGSYDAAGYRTLLNRLQDRNQEHMVGLALLLEWLPKLLTSNVVLDRSGARVGDIGPDGDDDDESFFCAQIRDADLPWDQGSIDW